MLADRHAHSADLQATSSDDGTSTGDECEDEISAEEFQQLLQAVREADATQTARVMSLRAFRQSDRAA